MFGAGITPNEIVIAQIVNGSGLILTIGSDKVTLSSSFYSSGYRVEEVHFASGVVWTWDHIFNMSIVPTGGSDSFYGDDRANTLSGGAGADYLNARSGSDLLLGGEGDDKIHGGDGFGDGHDTLIGGVGNDTLQGSEGNDIYVFNRGDGHDTIDDTGYVGTDTLQLGEGISLDEVVITQSGSGQNLVLFGTDRITVSSIYSDMKLEQIRFSDRTIWSLADLLTRSLSGTSAADSLYGDAQSNTMDGKANNDYLSSFSGSDRLIGGVGNDTLVGGTQSDTFVFSGGFGADDY